jgi:hypothetical protein
MKLLILVLLVCVTPLFCLAQEHTRPASVPSPPPAPADSWINYNSPAGRYSVRLPTTPKLSTQESASADGVKFTQYMSSAESSTAVFLTGYFDQLPNTTFNFDRARDGMVNAVNGTLVSESQINLGTSLGRELLVAGRTATGLEFMTRARLYQVQTRVFVLQVIYQKESSAAVVTREGNKYFDSFRVTPL